MKDLMDLVLKPTPPDAQGEIGAAQSSRRLPNTAQAWLRRVAFLLATSAPVLGCSDPGPKDVCADYAAKTIECDSYYSPGDQAQLEMYCHSYLDYASQSGPMCNAAFQGYYACISTLSCVAIDQGSDECDSEMNAVSEHCNYYYY